MAIPVSPATQPLARPHLLMRGTKSRMSKTMILGAAKTMFDKVRFHAAGQKLPSALTVPCMGLTGS
jgi:hypothetical protein